MDSLASGPAALSRYLTFLAGYGAAVGTMSRRLSAIRFAHRIHDLGDPTANARVVAVWEGMRRTHSVPAEQEPPLMPPELFQVLDACPVTRTWKTRGRPPEPHLAGARDRALLLVGFVGAFRRSELAAIDVEGVVEHPMAWCSASAVQDQSVRHGARAVVVPRAGNRQRCAVRTLEEWLDLAGVSDGSVFRGVSKGNHASARALHPESINQLVQGAVARASLDPARYSAHSLRADFIVTYAHLRGASDRAIAHQTRHRSLATLGAYVRVPEAWEDNAATQLGF